MTLAFYKVDNSKNYERHTFDDICMQPSKVRQMLNKLEDKGDEVRYYDLNVKEQVWDFQEDYNDEILDGGWWCITIND